MKINLFFLYTLLILFSACTKYEEPKDLNMSVNSRNERNVCSLSDYGFIKFESRESFDEWLEKANTYTNQDLDEWATELNFTSLRMRMESRDADDHNLNARCEDRLLLSILDEYGLIQVGKYIFKIETDLSLCWTMSEVFLRENYNYFISRRFNKKIMNVFNTNFEERNDVDIYEFLEEGNVGINNMNALQTRGIFGNDHKPPPVIECSVAGICNKGDAKATYQNALAYKSLYTELKTYKKGSGSSTYTPLSTDICLYNSSGNSNCYYKPRKQSSQSKTCNSCNNGYHHDWRPYSGTRRLDNYSINGNFKFYCPSTSVWKEHHAGVYN